MLLSRETKGRKLNLQQKADRRPGTRLKPHYYISFKTIVISFIIFWITMMRINLASRLPYTAPLCAQKASCKTFWSAQVQAGVRRHRLVRCWGKKKKRERFWGVLMQTLNAALGLASRPAVASSGCGRNTSFVGDLSGLCGKGWTGWTVGEGRAAVQVVLFLLGGWEQGELLKKNLSVGAPKIGERFGGNKGL